MKLSALLQPLIDAKADHELIMAQILAFEAEQESAIEKRRATDAARQARKRDRDTESRDVTLRHSDTHLTGDRVTRVEDKTSNSEIQPQKENKTPRAALEAVLDAERADAVLDHRQRIRKPLTEHAAKLLASKFAQCPDPNAAADTMIGNGWQGFEPDWLTRPSTRAPPQKTRGVQGVFGEFAENLENGQDHDHRSQPASGAAVLSLPNRRTG